MKRILYIEDTTATRMLVERQLITVGTVSAASDLAQGRQMLQEQHFDLLLSDILLPDGNALDLVRELRRKYSSEQLPVILVSSSMDHLLRVQCFQAGANDCFPMPTPWQVLRDAVQRMLEHPYVGSSGMEAVAVTWVEGAADDSFWLFCPELNLCLHGDRPDALRDTMAERVRAAVAGKNALPFVTRVKVSERLVTTAPLPAKTPGR